MQAHADALFRRWLCRVAQAAPTLLLIRDKGGALFGGIAHAPWQKSGSFYGAACKIISALQPVCSRQQQGSCAVRAPQPCAIMARVPVPLPPQQTAPACRGRHVQATTPTVCSACCRTRGCGRRQASTPTFSGAAAASASCPTVSALAARFVVVGLAVAGPCCAWCHPEPGWDACHRL